MQICNILLRKSHWIESVGLIIGIPLVLFLNFLIGGVIRQLFMKIVSNEVESDEDYWTLKGFFVNSLWGIFGTLALIWLIQMWNNAPLK